GIHLNKRERLVARERRGGLVLDRTEHRVEGPLNFVRTLELSPNVSEKPGVAHLTDRRRSFGGRRCRQFLVVRCARCLALEGEVCTGVAPLSQLLPFGECRGV